MDKKDNKPILVRICIPEQTKESYTAREAREAAIRLMQAGLTYITTEQIKGKK